MEESGHAASTRPDNKLEQGSEEEPPYSCQQCAESSQTVASAGFCLDCDDYLCKDCILQHKLFRGMRRHVIQEGTDVFKERPQCVAVGQCPDHGRPLEQYCQFHDTFGCILCFTVGHSSCTSIKMIADISKAFETSDEMMGIENVLQQQKTSFDSCRKLIQQCHEDNEHCYEESLSDFRSFRSKMERMLVELGDYVLTQAGLMRTINSKKLGTSTKQLTSLKDEFDSLMYEMAQARKVGKVDQVFIVAKRNRKKIEDIVKQLTELKTEIKIQRYTFETHPAMTKIVKCNTNMGRVNVLSPDESSTSEVIRSPTDTVDCSITGVVVISPSELVVTDLSNNCVKKIDMKRKIILQSIPANCPCDIAVLPGSKVAVTEPPESKLQVISTDNGLTPSHSIDVDGWCLGIGVTGDRIVVSFRDPGKVQVLDMSGTPLVSFATDPSLDLPRYLCMRNTSIYISHPKKNTVTCVSTDGTVQWTYTDDDMKNPFGIATRSDGSVYVVSRNSHSIHVLSADGAKQAIVSTKEFKLQYPRVMCCPSSRAVLYVSSDSGDPTQNNLIKTIHEPISKQCK